MVIVRCCIGAIAMLGLTAVSGCASDARVSESTRAVESVLAARAATGAAQANIDRGLNALAELQNEGDMQGSFANYVAAVNQIQADDEKGQSRLDDMNARRDAYISRWSDEAAVVQNKAVRAGMEERRNQVAARFNGLTETAKDVHETYQPFVKDLRDIQKALSLDLTAAGATALKPAIEEVKRSGGLLKQKLSTLEDELNDMIDKMSVPPVTAPTTATQ